MWVSRMILEGGKNYIFMAPEYFWQLLFQHCWWKWQYEQNLWSRSYSRDSNRTVLTALMHQEQLHRVNVGELLALCLVLFKHSSRSLSCERDPLLGVTPFPWVSPTWRVIVNHYLVILPIPFCSLNSSIILLKHKFYELPPFKFLE